MEVCSPPTPSPESSSSVRTCVSACAAGDPGTVVAARAMASPAMRARSRASASPTTTLTMSAAPSPPGVGVDALTVELPVVAGDGLPTGRAPALADADDCAGLDGLATAPSAHAGLCETRALAGPQAARLMATSTTAASPQTRVRLRPATALLPQRMAAGPRPVLLALPTSFRGAPFVLSREPAPALRLSLEPTVRVGVRAAARREPAARRAPSGSSMGEACPS